MSLATTPEPKLMTAEEFLAIPEDGIARELIDGIVKERGMTLRNRQHASVQTRIASRLLLWLDAQPEPRGDVVDGDCGFRLKRDPDVLVGPDVAYASADLLDRIAPKSSFLDGAPVLAVEILSPSDNDEDVADKVELYLEAGIVVWIVDPRFRIVRVHRAGQLTQSFNEAEEIDADPYMPGLRVPVAAIFAGRAAI